MLISLQVLGSPVRSASSAWRSGASWLHTGRNHSPGEWAGNLKRLSTVPVEGGEGGELQPEALEGAGSGRPPGERV